MSLQVHDRLLAAYAAFSAHECIDWSFFDPAVQHDQTEGLFLDGVFYGHDGLRAALYEIEADWDDLRLDPEEVVDLGDRVLVLVRMRARVRDSDAELDAQVAHLWEFRDGRVVRWTAYGDRATAFRCLRALGLFGETAQAA
jgi:ketosteroid isomerase-like protein